MRSPKLLLRTMVTLGTLALLVALPMSPSGAAALPKDPVHPPRAREPQSRPMNYRDVSELGARLQALAESSRHAQRVTIGNSLDYTPDANRPTIYPIYAIRISASTDENIGDDSRKNSILFEAGSHPREWLTTESALMLAEYLVDNAEAQASGVPGLLASVDVWIIPLTNPAGRAIDDMRGGDPRQYSTSPSSGGWRGNGDTRGCQYGVNVARNFSSGWNGEPATDCTYDNPGGTPDDDPDDFRGFAPFSTTEATALRNFVQNHGISMAVVLHSNSQKIWNRWGAGDTAGATIAQIAQLAWANGVDDPNLALALTRFGGGLGQFAAWLSAPSDTANQPDVNTVRGIQTIFIELPFSRGNYGGDYRYGANDGSNGFHPSSEHVRDLINGSFIPMAKTLISQSRSPGCPNVLGGPYGCPRRDFGLVGAKIGRSELGAGLLRTNPAGCLGTVQNGLCNGTIQLARDYLPVGQHHVDYRVQNFSARAANNDVDVRMTVIRTINRADGSESTQTSEVQSFRNVPMQELRTGRFALNVDRADVDFTVTLEIVPAAGSADGFSENDKKVFKFRSSAQ